jgi:hypothetical protein
MEIESRISNTEVGGIRPDFAVPGWPRTGRHACGEHSLTALSVSQSSSSRLKAGRVPGTFLGPFSSGMNLGG